MNEGYPRNLGGGVLQFQTSLWETNALLVVRGREALLVDPNLSAAEIAAIAAEAKARAGGPTWLLVTHADFDHVCGVSLLPDALVACGPETAEAIESGRAGEGLAKAALEWGYEWPLELRVDRVLEPGAEAVLGTFRVETIDARGHRPDGLAFLLLDHGVLCPGDYLSPIEYPILEGSLDEYRRTLERLLEAIARHDLRWVVPGHGPALGPEAAGVLARADLAYLERLAGAAAEARGAGLPPMPALARVYQIEPPRPIAADLAIFDVRGLNARVALREAGLQV